MTLVRSRLVGLVAATLVAAAGLVGLSSSPAAAALCAGAGVNVVVDFNGLEGGVQKRCDPDGAGRPADEVFRAAGLRLTPVSSSPGFVCRVEGQPSTSQETCAHTPPANAYWGLFWSDGTSGTWHYASSGVNGLDVPDGGFVAFSWQGSESKDPPSASPVNTEAPSQQPTRTPTTRPTKRTPTKPGPTKTTNPAGASTTTAPAAAASVSTRARTPAKASTGPTTSASATPSVSASTASVPGASDTATPAATSAQDVDGDLTPAAEHGRLPVWVPLVVIAALAGGAGGVVWRRRRSARGSAAL